MERHQQAVCAVQQTRFTAGDGNQIAFAPEGEGILGIAGQLQLYLQLGRQLGQRLIQLETGNLGRVCHMGRHVFLQERQPITEFSTHGSDLLCFCIL